MLERNSVMCKRNFGSMPTQHKAFAFLGYSIGEFPESEYVGDNGLHFGIHQYLSREDLDYVSDLLHEYFSDFAWERNHLWSETVFSIDCTIVIGDVIENTYYRSDWSIGKKLSFRPKSHKPYYYSLGKRCK